VCLIKPSALGDIVQSLPVLRGLRQRWPNAHIAWVARPALSGLLVEHPDLNEIIQFHREARRWRRVTETLSLARRLRSSRFDLVIDLQGLARSAWMCLACGAPRRVGFANARELAPWAYTDRIAVSTMEQSAITRYWLIAQALGCQGSPPAPRLGLSPKLRQWAAGQLASLPRPVLAIHVGAQWATKRWPASHFAQLARQAQTEAGVGVVLVGGAGERAIAQWIADCLPAASINLAERTNLLELAAILEAADVVCSGDSGPMHLAAAVGTRVVGLFTCTSPVRAGPYWPGSRVVATSVPCAASYLRRCASMICMQELTPQRVWPVVRGALAEIAPRRESRAG
jgi:lipopolysaccharide heptosyltransferase I